METWRPVIEDDGYEVSNAGRVRSIDRVIVRSDGVEQRWKLGRRMARFRRNLIDITRPSLDNRD